MSRAKMFKAVQHMYYDDDDDEEEEEQEEEDNDDHGWHTEHLFPTIKCWIGRPYTCRKPMAYSLLGQEQLQLAQASLRNKER